MLTTSGNQSSNNCEDITQRKMQMRILPIFNMLNLFLLNFNRKTYCSFFKKSVLQSTNDIVDSGKFGTIKKTSCEKLH